MQQATNSWWWEITPLVLCLGLVKDYRDILLKGCALSGMSATMVGWIASLKNKDIIHKLRGKTCFSLCLRCHVYLTLDWVDSLDEVKYELLYYVSRKTMNEEKQKKSDNRKNGNQYFNFTNSWCTIATYFSSAEFSLRRAKRRLK